MSRQDADQLCLPLFSQTQLIVQRHHGQITSDAGLLPIRQLDQRWRFTERTDERKNGLHLDRLSCHRFLANFWRLLLHTAAFNLLNALRDHDLIPAESRRARPATWRSRLIKVAATVVQTTRRVVIQLAAEWPYWSSYQAAFRRACALPNGA